MSVRSRLILFSALDIICIFRMQVMASKGIHPRSANEAPLRLELSYPVLQTRANSPLVGAFAL